MIAPLSWPRKVVGLTLAPLPVNARIGQLLCPAGLVLLGLILARLPLFQATLVLGGSIGLILVLLQPILSLFLLIPVIPFSPLVAITVGGINVGLMEILLAVGISAWLLKVASGQTQRSQALAGQIFARPRPVLLLPFLLLIGGVSLSWLNALSIGASLVETIKWVEMLGLYLLVVALLPARHIRWVVAVILLSGMAQAALGLYQFVFKIGPEGFLLFGGRFLRAYGSFAQPNPYGGYLGLILPLALAVFIWGLGGGTEAGDRSFHPAMRVLRPVGLSVPLGVLLAGLLASQSRSAWLGFAGASVAVLAIYNKKSAAVLAAGGLVGGVVALIGAFEPGQSGINTGYAVIIQRLVEAGSVFSLSDISRIEINDANFATIERLAHWQAAGQMWRDNLWLGIGFGNYAEIYPAYAIGRWLDPLGHAHNYWLNIGAETGLIGITIYLIFWILGFGVLWRAVRHSSGFNRAVAVGAFGIMVHLHVHNLFDNLYVQGMYLHVAIVLALISIIYKHGQA